MFVTNKRDSYLKLYKYKNKTSLPFAYVLTDKQHFYCVRKRLVSVRMRKSGLELGKSKQNILTEPQIYPPNIYRKQL